MDTNKTNFNEAPATGRMVTDHGSYTSRESAGWRVVLSGSQSTWVDVLMNRYLFLALIALVSVLPASAQTSVFNCASGFASSGSCGVSTVGSGGQAFALVGASGGGVSGSQVTFVPSGSTHMSYGFIYQTKVNAQAFTSTFRFVPNGENLAFVIENNSNTNAGGEGQNFSSGAGCEAGFYQAFDSNDTPPNNIFALELDSYSPLTASGAFTYSSAQIYQAGQSPCLPNDAGANYYPTNKLSTSPVNLTNGSQGTSTGDVYSATLTYNGTNLTLNMYNVTAGGSCPGASCFTHVWTVDIPSWVGGNTAYVGFTAATGETSSSPLHVDSFSYSEGSTTQAAAPTQVATPKLSLAAGTYSSAQSVSISDTTSGATIYYTINGTTPTSSSAKYAGPIAVNSTETLEAIAIATGDVNSVVASADYTIGSSTPPPATSAQVINYAGGFAGNPSQIWLGNGAVYSGSSIQLSTSNSYSANNAWYKTPVNVQAFTTTFSWTARCPAQPTQCGDGMGFMIISSSNPSSSGYNYLGFNGSQISWSRCSDSTDCPAIKSILVKFDLYNNSTEAGGANLTGFYSGGVSPQPPQTEYDMAPSGISMQSGHLIKATLTYNGTVLMEAVTDTVTGATYRNSYSANIPALVGGNTAFVGFGGSTGGATVAQNIQSWTYTEE
jgi:hypothetical protein